MLINALVKMTAGIADVICITQITYEVIHNTLLIDHGWLRLLHFKIITKFTASENWLAVSFSLNLIYSISQIYFLYKLSFLLNSLLDNGAKMIPKRRSVFSLIFIVSYISKFNLIRISLH